MISCLQVYKTGTLTNALTNFNQLSHGASRDLLFTSLQDRHIDQLCHGALLDPAFFGSSWGVVCKPNRQRHWRSSAPPKPNRFCKPNRLRHWRYSAPPFAFRSRIEKPLSPRWCSSTPSKGTAGIRTQDLLFTRQALWPAKPRRPAGPRILWQQLRGGLQTKSPAALALLCTPVCITFSDKKKTLSPRWCSSSPSKGTAGIRTQDLLFTKQAL